MKNDYFQHLNYTLGNEDSRLEFDVLGENCPHVVSVCGSGGRVIPLLGKSPREITVVDVSPVQLALLRLRIATLGALTTEEYLTFWAFPIPAGTHFYSRTERKRRFETLDLDTETRALLTPLFIRAEWNSLLLEGRWEKTFFKLSQIVRGLLGSEWVERFFRIEDETEHRDFMRNSFPRARWSLVLALVSNATLFNFLLYRGKFPKKNLPQTYLGFYLAAFDRLFAQGPARRNFFLQLCFLGELRFPTGLPAEAQPDLLSAARANLGKTKWNFIAGDVLESIAHSPKKVAFVSLSDVPSYFTPPTEQTFLQKIWPGLTENGVVVSRNYLRIPEGLDAGGYRELTENYDAAIRREQMQMYDIHVYEKIGAPA